VPARQHKPIPVRPLGIFGVMIEEARPKHIPQPCGLHGSPGMAGIGFLHRVHGKKAQGIHTQRSKSKVEEEFIIGRSRLYKQLKTSERSEISLGPAAPLFGHATRTSVSFGFCTVVEFLR
jgi:hypothetical protein